MCRRECVVRVSVCRCVGACASAGVRMCVRTCALVAGDWTGELAQSAAVISVFQRRSWAQKALSPAKAHCREAMLPWLGGCLPPG